MRRLLRICLGAAAIFGVCGASSFVVLTDGHGLVPVNDGIARIGWPFLMFERGGYVFREQFYAGAAVGDVVFSLLAAALLHGLWPTVAGPSLSVVRWFFLRLPAVAGLSAISGLVFAATCALSLLVRSDCYSIFSPNKGLTSIGWPFLMFEKFRYSSASDFYPGAVLGDLAVSVVIGGVFYLGCRTAAHRANGPSSYRGHQSGPKKRVKLWVRSRGD